MKKCNKCKIEKDYSNFRKRKASKDGHGHTCKECKFSLDKEYRDKTHNKVRKEEWISLNKEKIKDQTKEYYETNKEKIKDWSKTYYTENKEKIKNNSRDWRKSNKSLRNKRERDKRSDDPIYYISEKIRGSINKSMYRNGYSKKSRTHEILGCSFIEFKLYLESKFESWMNWGNKGLYNGEVNYGWDIDHIIPLSTATCEQDIIRLNHYTNLQPLCSKINRDIKRDIVNYEQNLSL